MEVTKLLNNLGQSLWRDNTSRDLLERRTLGRYFDEFAAPGFTSNPKIVDLTLEDTIWAAYLFRSIWKRRGRVGGWVSLEVSWKELAPVTGSKNAAPITERRRNSK